MALQFLVAIGSTLLCLRFRTVSITAAGISSLVIVLGLIGGGTSWFVGVGSASGDVVANDVVLTAIRSLGRALGTGGWYPPTIVLSAVWIAIAVRAVTALTNTAAVEP